MRTAILHLTAFALIKGDVLNIVAALAMLVFVSGSLGFVIGQHNPCRMCFKDLPKGKQ